MFVGAILCSVSILCKTIMRLKILPLENWTDILLSIGNFQEQSNQNRTFSCKDLYLVLMITAYNCKDRTVCENKYCKRDLKPYSSDEETFLSFTDKLNKIDWIKSKVSKELG